MERGDHLPDAQIAAENALICEKLLGLTKHCDEPGCNDWRTADGRRYWNNPTFETWAQAGLILDVIERIGAPTISWATSRGISGGWLCQFFQPYISAAGDSGPLAIRAAALEYIKALQS